jgi:hypothetical protein
MTVDLRRMIVVCVLVPEDGQICKHLEQLCKKEVDVNYQRVTIKC